MPDSVAGLPLHPLIVHAVVVLLPLSALGVLLVVAVPKLRSGYSLLVALGATAGAASAIGAKLTGEMLAAQTHLPVAHQNWGNTLVPIAVIMAVLTWILWAVQRRTGATGRTPALLPTGIVASLAALAVLVLTVLTGHSGSASVWGPGGHGSPAAQAGSAPTPDFTPAATPDAQATPGGTGATASGTPAPGDGAALRVITMAEVEAHHHPESCWAAVEGEVYDLTNWIEQHPGGRDRIIGLCGTDATAAFTGQHSGMERPAQVLESLRIGTLA